eukprot:PhM_4_TR15927/c0_g1_i1/m.43479
MAPPVNDPSEEESSWIVFRLFYFWVGPLLSRGKKLDTEKKLIETDDLLRMPSDENPLNAYNNFMEKWHEEQQVKAPKQPSLVRALVRAHKKDLIIGGCFAVLQQAALVSQPFMLQEFVRYLGKYASVDPAKIDINDYDGYLWSVGIALTMVVTSYCNHAQQFFTTKACCTMRGALTIALYEKASRLESGHRFTGIVSQMHGTDVLKFNEIGMFLQTTWVSVLTIIASLVALYFFIGWAGLLSIVIMLFLIPFQGGISTAILRNRAAGTRIADQRIRAISEYLQGIRVVKFMCWEHEIEKKIGEVRGKEMVFYRSLFILRAIMLTVIASSPVIVTFVVFAVAYADGTDIKPDTVFPTIAMLNVLRAPLIFLPMGIARSLDAATSVHRIAAFLQSEDRKEYVKGHPDSTDENAIILKNCTVQFPRASTKTDAAVEMTPTAPPPIDAKKHDKSKNKKAEEPAPPIKPSNMDFSNMFKRNEYDDAMKDININIPRGKLTIVIGPTGSGKSTLISLMSGEAIVKEGSDVVINGRTALVAQEAWIMNATLRDNILMGIPFDEKKYIDVINDSQLMADLHQLTASDQTEIGERGINLSGGQKQRVAFARAVYSGREIVLMDDPLSAVDSHVCVALMDECICGALDGRTRVLVTHQVQFLPRADHIIVVKDLGVVFQGTYEELQAEKIDVSELTNSSFASDDEEEEEINEADLIAKKEEEDAALAAATASASAAAAAKDKAKKIRGTLIPPPRTEDDDKIISKEDNVQGGVSSELLLWYYGRQGFFICLMTFLWFAIWRLTTVLTDLLVSWWSTRTSVIGKDPSEDEYLLWFGLFVIFSIVAIVIRSIPFTIGMVRCIRLIHEELLNRVLYAPMEFFDVSPIGRIVNRFSKDIEMIDVTIPETLTFFYQMIFVVLGAFGLMCYSAPYLSIIIVILIVAFIFLIRFYICTNRAVKRLESSSRSPVIAIMNETLGGLATIRAYNMVDSFSERHLQRLICTMRPTYSWRLAQRWLGLRVDAIGSTVALATSLLSTVLIVEVYDQGDAVDELSVLSLGITYSLAIAGAIGFLSQQTAEFEALFSSVERVEEYATQLPQERDVEYSSHPTGEFPPPKENWPTCGDITFEDISMRYRKRTPLVLKNVNFEIKSGQKVGLVGRTGSGKSTLLLVLFRMVELETGRIILDGQDISKLKMRDLRSAITIIPQDPLLFEGTMRTNLDPFNKHKAADVWQALERVGMADRVKQDLTTATSSGTVSEEWLEAPIDERGANYSVGQRQLLCLARALLKRTRILLLDEATASVDTEADALIQRTIRDCFTDCTVLTIAHRLQTIIDGDRVVVLDHGNLKEFDTPKNLLDNPESQFYQMVKNLGEEKFNELYNMAK